MHGCSGHNRGIASTIGMCPGVVNTVHVVFWVVCVCAQILFVAGVAMVIGMQNTALFFLKRARGAACFLGGMVLVFFGWPITGMLIEVFGIFNLFGYVPWAPVCALAWC